MTTDEEREKIEAIADDCAQCIFDDRHGTTATEKEVDGKKHVDAECTVGNLKITAHGEADDATGESGTVRVRVIRGDEIVFEVLFKKRASKDMPDIIPVTYVPDPYWEEPLKRAVGRRDD